MRLSIRIKLFLLINSLVIVFMLMLMIFTKVFIQNILIDKYEAVEIHLFETFKRDYRGLNDMGEIIKGSGGEFKGFVSIVGPDLIVKQSNTPGIKRGSNVQPEFSASIRQVVAYSGIPYQTFVLDAVRGEGNTLLQVGHLVADEYYILESL